MTSAPEFNPYATRATAADAANASEPGRLTQDDLLTFLARQAITILLVAAICVLVTFVVVTTTDPSYRANAQVLVERNRSPSLRTDILPDAQLSDVINTEAILAKSPPVLAATIEKAGVLSTAAPELAGGAEPLAQESGGLLEAIGLRQSLPEREAWLERLNRRILVRAIPDSNVLALSYPDKNPERAARIVNALVDAYFAERLRVFKGKGEADVYNAEAAAAQAELDALNRQLDAIDGGGRLAAADQRQTALATESAQLNTARLEAERRRRELAALYFDDHPEMQRITSDIATIDRRLGAIAGQVADIDQRQRRANQVRVKLAAAEQKFLAARRELDQAALRETEDTALTNVRLIHAAATPTKPAMSPLRALMLSLPFGLVLGLAIAFLREYFSPRRA